MRRCYNKYLKCGCSFGIGLWVEDRRILRSRTEKVCIFLKTLLVETWMLKTQLVSAQKEVSEEHSIETCIILENTQIANNRLLAKYGHWRHCWWWLQRMSEISWKLEGSRSLLNGGRMLGWIISCSDVKSRTYKWWTRTSSWEHFQAKLKVQPDFFLLLCLSEQNSLGDSANQFCFCFSFWHFPFANEIPNLCLFSF